VLDPWNSSITPALFLRLVAVPSPMISQRVQRNQPEERVGRRRRLRAVNLDLKSDLQDAFGLGVGGSTSWWRTRTRDWTYTRGFLSLHLETGVITWVQQRKTCSMQTNLAGTLDPQDLRRLPDRKGSTDRAFRVQRSFSRRGNCSISRRI
jgi:hypothetical protein